MALPVPDGFVCTTAMGKKFITEGKLATLIREQLHRVERNEEELTAAAERIRRMILTSPLPPEIGKALADAYRELQTKQSGEGGSLPAISVRSSGVSEDSAEFSFAGQFSSLLNIRGIDALFNAYREVLASGFSVRAISYRLNAGLSPIDFDLAVLCQVMVDAACAGVLFTRDPSNPESERMLISAVPGLGTMAVGGAVPADLYRPRRTVIEDATGFARAGEAMDWAGF